MQWWEEYNQQSNQSGIRDSYELQLCGVTDDDNSFATETQEIRNAVVEWLAVRKQKATDVYIIVKSIRKYHTPLIDFWNAMQEEVFAPHTTKYRAISGSIDIEDASTGKRTTYSISPLTRVAE